MNWFDATTRLEHKMQQLETWRREADVVRQIQLSHDVSNEDCAEVVETATEPAKCNPQGFKRVAT